MESGAQINNSPSPEVGGNRTIELPQKKGGEFVHTPEVSHGPEIAETQPKQMPQPAPIMPLPQLPVLSPSQSGGIPQVQKPVQDTNPQVASDDDVIEKEWVDKAKQIVSQTKDDPYIQEKEVSRLQADYLKKRYGKELKLSGD